MNLNSFRPISAVTPLSLPIAMSDQDSRCQSRGITVVPLPVNHADVVVVEHSRLSCETLVDGLRSRLSSVSIAFATTIDEAQQRVLEHRPRVVLLATSLPNRSWVSVAESIVAAVSRVRIVLLDDCLHVVNVKEAVRLQAHGYRTKQEPLADIAAAIEEAKRGKLAYCPQSRKLLVMRPDGVYMDHRRLRTLVDALTPRELDVLVHLVGGMTVKDCALMLGLSPSTVDNCKTRVMRKLRVHKTADMVRLAIREGIVEK